MENTRAAHHSFDFTLRATCLGIPGRGEDRVRITWGVSRGRRRQRVTRTADSRAGAGWARGTAFGGRRRLGPHLCVTSGRISAHPAGMAAGGLSRHEREVKQRAGPLGRLAVAP